VDGSQFRDLAPSRTTAKRALVLEPGDTLRVTCDWYQRHRDVLDSPEMCVAIATYYPALRGSSSSL